MSVCFASWSAASATCWLKSAWIRRVVSVPTITANPSRITSVSAAEPPASRQRIGCRLYAEYVARAADRMEESRLATGFELSSQVGHEDLDRVRDRERVIAPHLVEQLLTADHEALVAHQVLEQLELTLREVDLPLPARHFMGVRVEREVTHPQRRHPARRPPAQQRPHPREQLLALERLHEIVVRTDVQPLHPALERIARREHQDRSVVTVVAQPLGHVDPVQPRQAEVQNDDVRQKRVRLIQSAHTIRSELHLVTLEAQRALQDLGDFLIVFDDEHANGSTGGIHGVDGTRVLSGS